MGGLKKYPENGKSWGVGGSYVKFPPWWGYGYFLELHIVVHVCALLLKVGVTFILCSGCPMPPPTFAHANITTHPVLNSKGSYVDYSCNDGYYLADDQKTRILCDKDPSSHGYKWSGNFTCKSK